MACLHSQAGCGVRYELAAGSAHVFCATRCCFGRSGNHPFLRSQSNCRARCAPVWFGMCFAAVLSRPGEPLHAAWQNFQLCLEAARVRFVFKAVARTCLAHGGIGVPAWGGARHVYSPRRRSHAGALSNYASVCQLRHPAHQCNAMALYRSGVFGVFTENGTYSVGAFLTKASMPCIQLFGRNWRWGCSVQRLHAKRRL